MEFYCDALKCSQPNIIIKIKPVYEHQSYYGNIWIYGNVFEVCK